MFVCVSDTCSGICAVAESVRQIEHSLRVTADFTPTTRRTRRRSSTSMVRHASSIRKTTSDWQDMIGTDVRLMMLCVNIYMVLMYIRHRFVVQINHVRDVCCYLCQNILVIFVTVIGLWLVDPLLIYCLRSFCIGPIGR